MIFAPKNACFSPYFPASRVSKGKWKNSKFRVQGWCVGSGCLYIYTHLFLADSGIAGFSKGEKRGFSIRQGLLPLFFFFDTTPWEEDRRLDDTL